MNPFNEQNAEVDVETDDDFEVVLDETEEDGEVEAASEPDDTPVDSTESSDAEDDDSAEGDDEDDVKSYSKQVQKRIFREIRLRKKIEEEANRLRAEHSQATQTAAQRAAEVEAVRRQLVQLEANHAAVLDHAFETQISLKAKDLRAARESGEYDTELKLQSELDQLRFQHNQVKDTRRNIEARAKAAANSTSEAPASAPAQPQQPAKPQASPYAHKWLARNENWFNNPKFKAHRNFAIAVDEQLTAEGYNQNTEAYFAELDKRIDDAFPTLRKKPAAPAGKTTPVAGASRAPAPTKSKKTVSLTKNDLKTMEKFGLDPSNKEHLREFARQKRAAAAG